MEEQELELRMYGFVNYQLSGIQKGIQFAHAIVEYSIQHYTEKYIDWAENHKTVILLNGGTTNDNSNHPGDINLYAAALGEMNIPISCFYEPDLGDQLTSVAFIIDERVYDFKKYPDPDWIESFNPEKYNPDDQNDEMSKWIYSIGGYQNYKLREFIKNFELA